MVYNNFMNTQQNPDRDRAIFQEYVEVDDSTLRSIARKYGVSHQRVAAIIGREAQKQENSDLLDRFMSKFLE